MLFTTEQVGSHGAFMLESYAQGNLPTRSQGATERPRTSRTLEGEPGVGVGWGITRRVMTSRLGSHNNHSFPATSCPHVLESGNLEEMEHHEPPALSLRVCAGDTSDPTVLQVAKYLKVTHVHTHTDIYLAPLVMFSSSHQVAKRLELQLQQQSFQ